MADIKYNPDYVEGSMNNIQASLKKMESSLQQIQEGLQSTMLNKSNWDSSAADYFSSQCQALFKSMSDFSALKTNIESYMDQVKNNYRATTAKTSNLFQSLLSKLGGGK